MIQIAGLTWHSSSEITCCNRVKGSLQTSLFWLCWCDPHSLSRNQLLFRYDVVLFLQLLQSQKSVQSTSAALLFGSTVKVYFISIRVRGLSLIFIVGICGRSVAINDVSPSAKYLVNCRSVSIFYWVICSIDIKFLI